MMNPAEFANIAEVERDFWWYRGMRVILNRLLDPLLAGRKVQTVLEAGCGTGYNALVFERCHRWRVVPLAGCGKRGFEGRNRAKVQASRT